MVWRPIVVFLLLVVLATPASATNALCFTDDDGRYPCAFIPFGGNGSFVVEGRGKPTFGLSMNGDGTAEAVMKVGHRGTAPPGPYIRSKDDRASWVSGSTDTRICVW